nr:MAG: hypothetical protein E4H34_00045 [Hyphomicrobiales bacterium]
MTILEAEALSYRPATGSVALFDAAVRDARAYDSETRTDTGRRIAFFLAHEQPHQIPHCAPIVNELSRSARNIDIQIFVLGEANADLMEGFLSPSARKAVQITTLPTSHWVAALEMLIGQAAPLRRIESLIRARRSLSQMDVIVGPATTFLMLKTHFGLRNTKFVYTGHGTGDRAVGFKRVIKKFDHVFVAGEKVKDRMLGEGIIREGQYSIVGYPKFSAVSFDEDEKLKLFNNNNPVILYNPHFDPNHSSWYRHGAQVLELFSKLSQYNLIFAPHVMLFSRRVHAGVNPLGIRWRKSLKDRFKDCANIHVDTGSRRSIDMTYTRAADIYLGDGSSQVYEFIARPRPCIFLNSHKIVWKNNANFAHWNFGQVLNDPSQLEDTLENIACFETIYRSRQESAVQKTFGENIDQSAKLAANALLNLLA